MPFSFHENADKYFEIQYKDAKNNIIPFIEKKRKVRGKKVAELGCGEAGIIKAFEEIDCECYGVDLSEEKIRYAKKRHKKSNKVNIERKNIFEVKSEKNKFDIVLVKDTIEHVSPKKKLLEISKNILNKGGIMFVGFPPWQMPFGGHQQITDSMFGKTPFCHLLPKKIYKKYLKLIGEREGKIEHMMSLVETGLSIEEFEELISESGCHVVEKKYYMLNPIYEYKFGVRPIEQFPFVYEIPWIRNFLTTTVFYLLEFKGHAEPSP